MPKKKESEEKKEETVKEEEKVEDKKEDSQKTKSKKLSEKEYEKKVLELAEKGLTSEKIGETLRKENIHPKEYYSSINSIQYHLLNFNIQYKNNI